MYTTQILMNEHRVIEQVLDCLDAISDSAMGLERLDCVDANKVIDFLFEFADGCHHAKEERVLFPALEAIGFSASQGPTAIMRMEHEHGRSLLAQMREAVLEAEAGLPNGPTVFAYAAGRYLELLRMHIRKEDNCLFPAADEALSGTAQRTLTEQCEYVEEHEVGENKHEYYLGIANDLADKYDVPRAQFVLVEQEPGLACCHSHGQPVAAR